MGHASKRCSPQERLENADLVTPALATSGADGRARLMTIVARHIPTDDGVSRSRTCPPPAILDSQSRTHRRLSRPQIPPVSLSACIEPGRRVRLGGQGAEARLKLPVTAARRLPGGLCVASNAEGHPMCRFVGVYQLMPGRRSRAISGLVDSPSRSCFPTRCRPAWRGRWTGTAGRWRSGTTRRARSTCAAVSRPVHRLAPPSGT